MQNFDLEKENGRSMIEMLGVLAIIGVLSVGGIAGYSKAMQKYRINKTIEQITLIAGNVRSFFAPQRSYADLWVGTQIINGTTKFSLLKKAKIVPDEMWYSETALRNAFDEYVDIFYAQKNDTDSYGSFGISSRPSTEEVCIELSTYDWSMAGVSVIYLASARCGLNYYKPPMDVNIAAEKCTCIINDSTAGGSTTTMSFYFDIDVNSTYWQNKLNPSS